MMTKKAARRWKAQVDRGERPPIPRNVAWLFGRPALEIKDDIAHAIRWDYGKGPKAFAERLVLMGLLDKDFNFTDLGREYLERGQKQDAPL
jgi:hypothetical protein